MRSGYNPDDLLANMNKDWEKDKAPSFTPGFFDVPDVGKTDLDLTQKRNKPDQSFLRDDKKEGRKDLDLPRNTF